MIFPDGTSTNPSLALIFARTSIIVNRYYKTEYKFDHVSYRSWSFVPFRINVDNIEQTLQWIIETCPQFEWYWTITTMPSLKQSDVIYNFYFKNPQLAVLFKLTWG